MYKNTLILAILFLLLTSCNNSYINNKTKIEETKINNTKIVEKTKEVENKNDSESSLEGQEKNNNLQAKEKKEKMSKTVNVQKAPLQEGDLVAIMKTTNGTIKIKLFNKIVPNTVNNFAGLAQDGYYDGIIFHRVINGFMIQGGDPTGTGMGGESIYGEKFRDEFSDDLKNIKYSISMANSGENTNGSQFFINQADNNYLDNKHSVFGQVIEGMENVDKIANTKTNSQDKPVKDIKIINVKIEKFDGQKLVDFKLDEKESIKKYNEFLKKEKEAKNNKIIENGNTVSVHYTLTVDGKKIDSSLDRGQPFVFTVGKKMVIKGWDEGLVGHKIGDKFKLEVAPKDGYGEYDKNKTQAIPKEQLADFKKAGFKLEKGTVLPTQRGNLKIIDSNEKEVIIDANHELAGKILNFDIEVVDIK